MQVFNTYFRILKKRITAILIYAGVFLGLTITMTANAKINNTNFENKKVDIMVINQDEETELLKGFLNYMSNYVNFVEPGESKEAIKDALFYNKVQYILTIPAANIPL